MEKISNIDLSNQIFGLHISAELDAMRNAFCPSSGYYHCSGKCPIYQMFYAKGLSCNQALDRYPETCIALMNDDLEIKKGA